MKLYLERPSYPYFRMEVEEDLILGLIQKELHNYMLLTNLENVGFDSSYWPISLERIILTLVGIRRPSDDTYNWFLDMLNTLSEKMNEEEKYSSSDAAIELYQALKERRDKHESW